MSQTTDERFTLVVSNYILTKSTSIGCKNKVGDKARGYPNHKNVGQRGALTAWGSSVNV